MAVEEVRTSGLHDRRRRAWSHEALFPCWRRGLVVSVVRRMTEVTLRRARLVLGWVPCPCSPMVIPLGRHVQWSVTFAVAEDRFEPRPGRVRLLKKNYFK